MRPAAQAPTVGARPSLRRLAFWLPMLLAVFLLGAALFIAGVSLSVIRLADNAGEDSAPRLMEELRAVGNLERLVALGDQFAAERDPNQARRTALTMQALALHPSVATLSQRHQDVRSTFALMTELQVLREQQLASGTTREAAAALDATLQQRWHAQRLVLKDIADRTAVDLVNRTTETGRDISRSAHDILVTTAFGTLVGLTTCLLLLLVVRRYFLAPLLAVSAYLTSLRNGIEPSQPLPNPNTQEMADVMRIAGDLAQAQAALETLALRDQLTGLANRHALDARLDQSLARARRNGHRLALLFIDIDRFRSINDTLGHAIGDEFLKVMATRLSDSVRDADTVARLGGDEFIIVIDVPGEADVVADVARKLLGTLMQPVQLDSLELKSSASMGISLFPDDGETRGELMKNADLAMYHAKSIGRNNFQFFDASMNEAINAKLRLETDLRAGLAKGEMVLHFQPQVEGASGRLCGFEALVRWQPPGRPLVGPGEFIALAEETGLIGPLGDWVLAQACATLADWHHRGWTGIRMAINLSARQLKDHTLPERVSQHLQQHRLPPQAIELEVTESVAMDDPEMSIRNLRALKTLGITLAIDDFGTGYSSLAYLKLLPIDRLKLDRTFVRDIGIDPNDDVISAATIALAHSLRLELVAEGVETEGQRAFLAQQGCDTMQGYLFGKPMPAEDALARIEKELAPASA